MHNACACEPASSEPVAGAAGLTFSGDAARGEQRVERGAGAVVRQAGAGGQLGAGEPSGASGGADDGGTAGCAAAVGAAPPKRMALAEGFTAA